VTLRDLALSFGQPKESLQPTMVQVSRYFEAIPQYTVGHLDRVRHIEGALRQSPGLFATGNYLKGVSLNDCVTHANETAADLLNYLIPPDSSGEMILQQRRSSFTEISE
jgi:protoporphyrinogen oxidase